MLYRISFETPEKAVLFSAELREDERERLEKVLADLQSRKRILGGWVIERDAPASYHDLYQWFDNEGFFRAVEDEAPDWPYDWKRPT